VKQCSICAQTLPLTAFDKQATGKHGRRADCKDCRKRFNRTPKGLVKSLYSNQVAKSRKRGHPAPAYTEAELFDWLWSQPHAQALYDAWVSGGYVSDNKPSVDRLDDYLPYTLTNIRLVTWSTNNQRQYADRVAGINVKACHAVDQYSLDGQFITTHHSYKAAARAVKGNFANIRNVAEQRPIHRAEKNGLIRSYTPMSASGYIWRKHGEPL